MWQHVAAVAPQLLHQVALLKAVLASQSYTSISQAQANLKLFSSLQIHTSLSRQVLELPNGQRLRWPMLALRKALCKVLCKALLKIPALCNDLIHVISRLAPTS